MVRGDTKRTVIIPRLGVQSKAQYMPVCVSQQEFKYRYVEYALVYKLLNLYLTSLNCINHNHKTLHMNHILSLIFV